MLLQLGLSLSKVISMRLYSKAPVIFDGLELLPSSDISMRTYSAAEIEESAMLYAVIVLPLALTDTSRFATLFASEHLLNCRKAKSQVKQERGKNLRKR